MNISIGDKVTFTTVNAHDLSDKKIYTKSGIVTIIKGPYFAVNVCPGYHFIITKDDIVSINSIQKDKL